jgi:hypothetical protein
MPASPSKPSQAATPPNGRQAQASSSAASRWGEAAARMSDIDIVHTLPEDTHPSRQLSPDIGFSDPPAGGSGLAERSAKRKSPQADTRSNVVLLEPGGVEGQLDAVVPKTAQTAAIRWVIYSGGPPGRFGKGGCGGVAAAPQPVKMSWQACYKNAVASKV